jgi:hypothetical protein
MAGVQVLYAGVQTSRRLMEQKDRIETSTHPGRLDNTGPDI